MLAIKSKKLNIYHTRKNNTNELASPWLTFASMHTVYDCIGGESITSNVKVIVAGFEPSPSPM